MKRTPSLSKLRDTYWDLFAYYNKLKRADANGRVKCYTCPQVLKLGQIELHAGHCFKKSAFPGIRFHRNNVRPQCENCNICLDGNFEVFKENLINEIGLEAFNELDSQKRLDLKLTKHEYRLLITQIRADIRTLEADI